jgi:hypothetical protein
LTFGQRLSYKAPMDYNNKKHERIWLRISDAMNMSGISRSGLYEFFDSNGGPIKTSSLRGRGRTRGIRLINRQSLLEFIESCSCSGKGGAA